MKKKFTEIIICTRNLRTGLKIILSYLVLNFIWINGSDCNGGNPHLNYNYGSGFYGDITTSLDDLFYLDETNFIFSIICFFLFLIFWGPFKTNTSVSVKDFFYLLFFLFIISILLSELTCSYFMYFNLYS